MNLKIMQNQWSEFCETMNVNSPSEYFEKIKNQYSIPKRFYHTFEGHVSQGLEIFEEFKHLCENPNLVYFSWLLHDVIYDPRTKDNEEKSAGLAYQIAIKIGLPFKFADKAKDLVLITKHIQLPKTTDEKMIVDIDLSIFGQPDEIFGKYETNIREEYDYYPLEIYKQGRAKILQDFLEREHIYQTEEIRNKYEQKARENLQRSIEKLKSS